MAVAVGNCSEAHDDSKDNENDDGLMRVLIRVFGVCVGQVLLLYG